VAEAMADDRQYTYTWEHGSPEMAAHYRDLRGQASVQDLLLLALANARSADEALPPWATGPDLNNCGKRWTPDPWHASACAERACVYIERVQSKLLSEALAQVKRDSAESSVPPIDPPTR